MAINLFVGGIPYETSREELEKLFAGCGRVTHVKLIMDRDTGRSKGFGFVEMPDRAEAQAAIKKLNGYALGSRRLLVNEARPQEKRPPSGPAAAPGFVERRSGVKDRRRQPGAPAGERRWEGKPAWADKKKSHVGEKKSWGEKKPWGDKKKAWGEKKSWVDKKKSAGGDKKWDHKPKRPGDARPAWVKAKMGDRASRGA